LHFRCILATSFLCIFEFLAPSAAFCVFARYLTLLYPSILRRLSALLSACLLIAFASHLFVLHAVFCLRLAVFFIVPAVASFVAASLFA
jgi:hypothetical protein